MICQQTCHPHGLILVHTTVCDHDSLVFRFRQNSMGKDTSNEPYVQVRTQIDRLR